MERIKIFYIFFAGLAVGVITSLLMINPYLGEKNYVNQGETVEVSLMVDSGERIITCRKDLDPENPTAFDLLKICSESENFQIDYQTFEGMGTLVKSIAGSASTENKYWQYWVNNEYAEVAADNFDLNKGDVVFWKLTGQIEE